MIKKSLSVLLSEQRENSPISPAAIQVPSLNSSVRCSRCKLYCSQQDFTAHKESCSQKEQIARIGEIKMDPFLISFTTSETTSLESKSLIDFLSMKPLRNLTVIFEPSIKREEQTCSISCAICLDGYKKGQKIKKLPCNHVFHNACSQRWLKKQRRCPLCRKSTN